LAQLRGECLRAAVLMLASFCFAACTGGPHPEPPEPSTIPGQNGGMNAGTGGSAMMEPGNSGGSGGTRAGTGGSGGASTGTGGSGAAGSGAADGGNAACDRDTDDMDAGACASEDDAGALR
jgi:hypothetical protein